jgi:hypothetical protein
MTITEARNAVSIPQSTKLGKLTSFAQIVE